MPKKKYLLIGSLIVFLGFIYFSYLVAKHRFSQFDFDMTVRVQNHIPHKMDFVFTLFSLLGAAEITMAVWALLLIWSLFKKYWFTFQALFLLPLALFIELFGKSFVSHPNPPHLFYRGAVDFNLPSSYVQTGNSYPSGHLTRTAFIICFISVYLLYKRPLRDQILVQSVLVGFLLIMAVSRVYLGEHWLSDVLGGIMIGSSFGVITALSVPVKKLTSAGSVDKGE